MSGDTRAAGRPFVRSLNILLKFARLYEFGHARTGAQFDTAWRELKTALDDSGGSGLLLGASGNQILLDGVPLGAAAGERAFAQLLTSSGIASIHFGTSTSQAQFARFVRGFPSGNAKPTALAEQLKATLAGDTSIRINEIRYVAEDASVAGIKVAANLTAKVLGAQGDKFKDFFDDPNKLLQMILAAESSRGPGGGGSGPGTGGGGGVGGSGTGTLWDTGAGGSGGSGGSGSGGGGFYSGGGANDGGSGSGGAGVGVGVGGGGGTGSAASAGGVGGGLGPLGPGGGGESGPAPKWRTASALLRSATSTNVAGGPGAQGGYVAEDDVRQMLALFAQLGKSRKDPEARSEVPNFQSRLSAMPVRAQVTLQQALAGLAAEAPPEKADKPMLVKLAEHVAIRFALDSYERGELRVNAVKQLLDRMNAEIEGLRKILTSQEEVMAN